jgi:erythrocyte band 7 integral membrane protein
MSHAHDSSTIAESISSTKPILHDINNEITSATMNDINGKAPINGASNVAARLDEPLVKVQPPRREDLQPSYARVIQADDADADTNGWYGAMVSVLKHNPRLLSNMRLD